MTRGVGQRHSLFEDLWSYQWRRDNIVLAGDYKEPKCDTKESAKGYSSDRVEW